MAREEHDREDLLRDATAYVDRAEFDVPEISSPVFVGIRRDGATSVYLSPDRVYHFNSTCELRRAFVDGQLFKADRGELVSLARQRSEHETSLVSRRLSFGEKQSLLDGMHRELLQFANLVTSGVATACGEVTSSQTESRGETASSRVRDWLCRMPEQIDVARSPHVG